MKQKNILILVIIIVIIILGAVLALRKDVIVAPFVPDETIPAEVCRKAITRAQLKEITGYQNFVFEDIKDQEIPGIGIVEICDIRLTPEVEDPGIIGVGPAIGIIFFPEDATYEKIKEESAAGHVGMEIREIEDVGEKAFLIIMGEMPDLEVPEIEGEEGEMPALELGFPEMHQIAFLDADINQVIGAMVQEFSYEVLIALARQIEKNLR